MSAEVFLDTNIVVYAFQHGDPRKRDRARAILESDRWRISWQVVQEFANVARHRFVHPLTAADLADVIDLVLWPRVTVLPTAAIHRSALAIHQSCGFRLYDSLIVAAALASGARVLWSEDLQDGRIIDDLRIENPFASA